MLTIFVGANVNIGKVLEVCDDGGTESGGGGGGRPKISESQGLSIRDRISNTKAVSCTTCVDRADTAGSDDSISGCDGVVVTPIGLVRPTTESLVDIEGNSYHAGKRDRQDGPSN